MERGGTVLTMQRMSTSADRAEVPRTPEERRQSLTTWGIVALAVFVAVGMGEWSKRSAVNEVVMDPKILKQAMAMAAERKMEDRRSPQPLHAVAGRPQTRSEIGGAPSTISQLPSSIRSVSGEIQTSAGGER